MIRAMNRQGTIDVVGSWHLSNHVGVTVFRLYRRNAAMLNGFSHRKPLLVQSVGGYGRALGVGVLCVWGLFAGMACDASQSHSISLMNKGVKAYKEGNYPGAVEQLTEATRIWPDNDKAFYMLGQIYQHKYDQADKAVGYYEKATTINPEKSDYWYHKGSCLLDAKRDNEAEASLLKAVEMDKENADALYRLGILAERKSKPKQAAKYYGDSVVGNPRKPWAYYNLGDLYYRNQKYDEAQRVFKNGAENNPQHAELRHGLGLSYLSKGQYREALKEFEEALSLKQSYPSALYNIGITHIALKHPDKAELYLEKFLQEANAGDNGARIVAAEGRLMEIKEAKQK